MQHLDLEVLSLYISIYLSLSVQKLSRILLRGFVIFMSTCLNVILKGGRGRRICEDSEGLLCPRAHDQIRVLEARGKFFEGVLLRRTLQGCSYDSTADDGGSHSTP